MCRCPWSWLFKPCLLITPKDALDFEGKAAETTASFFSGPALRFHFSNIGFAGHRSLQQLLAAELLHRQCCTWAACARCQLLCCTSHEAVIHLATRSRRNKDWPHQARRYEETMLKRKEILSVRLMVSVDEA